MQPTRKPCPEDSGNVGILLVLIDLDCANRVNDDYRIVTGSGNIRNDCIGALP